MLNETFTTNELAEVQFFCGTCYFIDMPGRGPANATEMDSIDKIMRKYDLTKIINDVTPEILGYRLWNAVNSKLRRS